MAAGNNTTWWVLGGATAFVVGLGVLAARSAHAATAPPAPPAPIPTTPLHPMPRPTPPAPAPNAIVRQGSLSSTTSAAVVRILQRQLQQLGYAITRVDGRPSTELQQATLAFENELGLSPHTPNLELLLAVDYRYGQVFDPQNWRQY